MEQDLIAATLTFVATISGSYLLFRSQLSQARAQAEQERERLEAELARVKAEAEASKRDDNREEVQALWTENRNLREEIARRDGALDARIAQLERQIEVLRGEACPWHRIDCPREAKLAPVGAGRGE